MFILFGWGGKKILFFRRWFRRVLSSSLLRIMCVYTLGRPCGYLCCAQRFVYVRAGWCFGWGACLGRLVCVCRFVLFLCVFSMAQKHDHRNSALWMNRQSPRLFRLMECSVQKSWRGTAVGDTPKVPLGSIWLNRFGHLCVYASQRSFKCVLLWSGIPRTFCICTEPLQHFVLFALYFTVLS